MRDLMSATRGRFVLTVEAPAAALESVLRALPWVSSVEVTAPDNGRVAITVDVDDDAHAKRALPRAIIDADFVLISCEPQRTRLLDIFVESVGDGTN